MCRMQSFCAPREAPGSDARGRRRRRSACVVGTAPVGATRGWPSRRTHALRAGARPKTVAQARQGCRARHGRASSQRRGHAHEVVPGSRRLVVPSVATGSMRGTRCRRCAAAGRPPRAPRGWRCRRRTTARGRRRWSRGRTGGARRRRRGRRGGSPRSAGRRSGARRLRAAWGARRVRARPESGAHAGRGRAAPGGHRADDSPRRILGTSSGERPRPTGSAHSRT